MVITVEELRNYVNFNDVISKIDFFLEEKWDEYDGYFANGDWEYNLPRCFPKKFVDKIIEQYTNAGWSVDYIDSGYLKFGVPFE